jgi:hypothetical protein
LLLRRRNGILTRLYAFMQNAVMDRQEKSERWLAGGAVRDAREERRLRGRDYREHKHLQYASAGAAAVCADCLMPLAPAASVTLVARGVGGRHNRENLVVPVCLTCWLSDGSRNWNIDSLSYEAPRRFRCDGCGRPMRVAWGWQARYRRIPHRWHCCCEQCFRKATLRRANERRRVRHEEVACVVCGGKFVPGKSNAKTCGNRCRQQLHRDRHLPVVLTEADFAVLRRGQRFIGRDGKSYRR